MQMSPLIAVHMSAALGAVALGPLAIWARKGAVLRPRVHRAFGYGFVTLMLGASIKCPVDEIGKNSVSPSTIPITAALSKSTLSNSIPHHL